MYEDPFVIGVFVVLCFLIGVWANAKGRSVFGWVLAAVLFSPLFIGIVLLFIPKTGEKKAMEEADQIARVRNILGPDNR